MGMIGQATTKPATSKPAPRPTTAAPAQQAAKAPAPQSQGQTKSFGQARPRGANGLFLKGLPDGTAAKYTLKVNKVSQSWANPSNVASDRPQPTGEELQTAKPTFKKQDNYVIEVEVVESNNPACPVGYMASIVVTDKYVDSYFDDVKGFLCAALNAAPEQVDLADWQASYQPDQPLLGFFFDALVLERPTRNGGVFTKHIFNVSKMQHPE